jgi:hypothetical protein
VTTYQYPSGPPPDRLERLMVRAAVVVLVVYAALILLFAILTGV